MISIESEQCNEFYSPPCFLAIKQFIHLIPMWSQLVPTAEHPGLVKVVQSNAQVESYFRSLKFGTASKQKRLRPRELLVRELRRVLGAINEKKLPARRPCKDGGVKRLKAIAEVEEMWRQRKKRRTYGDPAVRRRLLTPKSELAKSIPRRSPESTAAVDHSTYNDGRLQSSELRSKKSAHVNCQDLSSTNGTPTTKARYLLQTSTPTGKR